MRNSIACFILLWASSAVSAELCPGIRMRGALEPSLSATERILVCGDSEAGPEAGDAWRKIPASQARYHLSIFLEDRGYFQARYSPAPEGGLIVELGPPSVVREIQVVGAPAPFVMERKHDALGARLRPKLLTQLEQWTTTRLQGLGYACASARAEADPVTGLVVIHATSGELRRFGAVEDDPIPGTIPGVLRRYDAFHAGDPYNGDLAVLTERRVLADGVAQSVHYTPVCEPSGVTLKGEIVPGLPRLLSFGFGTNTEGILLVRTSWKNTRLGPGASQFSVTALASAREQDVNATFSWYTARTASRNFLLPALALRHQNENPFEAVTAHVEVSPSTSWDGEPLGVALKLGPSWDTIRTLRGGGQTDVRLVSLDGELRLATHYFEYFKTSPRAGFAAAINTRLSSGGFISDVSLQQLRVSAEGLWNVFNYDPPAWIVALRGGGVGSLTSEKLGPQTRIPPTLRSYLGGSADLRGFGRQELTADGIGALSSIFASVEVRAASLLPFGVQPLAFLDAGALGVQPFTLDLPVFWSPGLGFRWESPIGTFRGTAAHGFLSRASAETPLSHWQLFVSFGEEF